MQAGDDLGDVPEDRARAFIGAHFRSVWTIELLCHLMAAEGTAFSHADLIAGMHASELVIRQGLGELSLAGLLAVEPGGHLRYAPASAELGQMAVAVRALYAKAPDAVRRLIVTSANPGLAAFADAFRLRPRS